MNIQDLKSNTTWQEASNTINNNNNKISLAIATLENAKLKNKGYFTTVEKLNEAVPNPTIGSKAYVGTSEPYAIYIVENGSWVDSGYTGGNEIVAKITTDRIENGAVTTEKIATSAFDNTLSVSGKIAPADVVGVKLNELDEEISNTNKHQILELQWTYVSGSFNKYGSPDYPSQYGNSYANEVAVKINADTVNVKIENGYKVMLGIFTAETISMDNRVGVFSEHTSDFSFEPNYEHYYAIVIRKVDNSIMTQEDTLNVSLFAVNNSVLTIKGELYKEKEDRQEADTAIRQDINGLTDNIDTLKELCDKGIVTSTKELSLTYTSGSFNKYGAPSIPSPNNNAIVINPPIKINAYKINVSITSGYKVLLGEFDTNEIAFDSSHRFGDFVTEGFEREINGNKYYSICIMRTDNGVMNTSEGSNVSVIAITEEKIYGYDKPTENLLTLMGVDKSDLFKSAKTPILTYIDDDTDISSIPNVKSICDDLGIKCTFSCITSRLESVSGLKALLQSYQTEGFHITCHSHTHNGWYSSTNKMTPQECEGDLVKSLVALKENNFLDSDIFVYPGNSQTRTELIPIVKKWCSAAFYGGTGVNTMYGNGRYDITREIFNISTHNTEYYKTLIDNAYNNGSWLVLFSHSANNSEFDTSQIREVLQYAKTKDMRIATANEALKLRLGMYQMYELFK